MSLSADIVGRVSVTANLPGSALGAAMCCWVAGLGFLSALELYI